MRLTSKRYLAIVLFSMLLSVFFCANAHAANECNNYPNNSYVYSNGWVVVPVNPNNITLHPDNPYSDSGMDGKVSFWDLPSWIKLASLSGAIVAVITLFKMMPLVGRLKHVLENTKTRDIFHFIQNNPGVTISELSREQNINRGTLKYHISQLIAYNKITFKKFGKFSRLFYNTPSSMDKESIISTYMRNDKSREILFSIMDDPGVTNQDLATRFSLGKSTVHEYLKKFSDDDIVEYRQDGKFKRYYIKRDARLIMLRHRD